MFLNEYKRQRSAFRIRFPSKSIRILSVLCQKHEQLSFSVRISTQPSLRIIVAQEGVSLGPTQVTNYFYNIRPNSPNFKAEV